LWVATAAGRDGCGGGGADWAVVEVGMGGRFDATTALEPELSVITGVALDHQAVLGETAALIAREKAGVLRPGVPAVTGAQGEALAVIAEEAARLGAPLAALGRDFHAAVVAAGWGGTTVAVTGDLPGLPLTLVSPLVGRHQARNVALAAAAALTLGVGAEHVRAAVAATGWPGRLERLDRDRAWVLDGAHNPEAAAALAAALDDLGGAATSPRAAAPSDVAAAARRAGATEEVHEAPDVAAALALARDLSRPGDLVLVAGSLFVVGEARSLLLGAEPEGRERWQ